MTKRLALLGITGLLVASFGIGSALAAPINPRPNRSRAFRVHRHARSFTSHTRNFAPRY